MAKKDDIIRLSDNKEYFVLSTINFENKEYLGLLDFDNKKARLSFCLTNKTDDTKLVRVVDEALIKKLSEKLAVLLKK